MRPLFFIQRGFFKNLFLVLVAAFLSLLSLDGLFHSISPAQARPGRSSPLGTAAPTISFDQARYFGSPADPTNDIAVGDLNGDGRLDLVVANGDKDFSFQGEGAIYLNDGQGNFISQTSFGEDDMVMSVILGDMNGDGSLDIIAGYPGWVKVFLNDGVGNYFSDQLDCNYPPNPLPDNVHCAPVGAYYIDYPKFMVSGDFDGNGTLDIIYTTSSVISTYIFLMRNDGDANFSRERIDFGDGSDISTRGLAAGDLNGDGALDIISRNIYWNNGNGAFTKSTFSLTYSSVIDIADMNGDGSLDIIEIAPQMESYILLNDGAGNFGNTTCSVGGPVPPIPSCDDMPPNVIPLHTRDETTSLEIADLNGDGDLDILMGNDFNTANYAYFNLGLQASKLAFSDGLAVGEIGNQTSSIHAADMNNDGYLDVIVGRHNLQSAVYLNGGQGSFNVFSSFGETYSMFSSLAAGDLNGDGAQDLVVGYTGGNEGSGGEPTLFLNDGRGAFPTSVNVGLEGDIQSIALGDINGDGSLDIVIAYGSAWHHASTIAFLNDGLGHFCSGTVACDATNFRSIGSGDDYTRSIALGDMNGDGSLDVVKGNFGYIDITVLPKVEYGQQSYVYLNDGQGNFYDGDVYCDAPPENVRCLGGDAETTTSLAVGDIDGNGSLDIVTGAGSLYSSNGKPNYIYLNDGAGNFTTAQLYGSGMDNTWGVALGDLNGDGNLDIINRDHGQPDLVLFNDGLGHFYAGPLNCAADSVRCLANNNQNHNLALADFDGDGDLDIAADYSSRSGTVYLNDDNGNFSGDAARLFATGQRLVVVSDVNGDGLTDLVSASGSFNSSVQIMLNRLRFTARFAGVQQYRIKVWHPSAVPETGFQHTPEILSQSVIPITYTLFSPLTYTLPGPSSERIGLIRAYYSLVGSGKWLPAIAASQTITSNLQASTWPTGTQHVFYWDTFASGFFGQSNEVVVRLEAYPQPFPTSDPNTYLYPNQLAGDYQWPYASAVTAPFRVRGTQVRVMNGDTHIPAAGAQVYKLSPRQVSVDSPLPGAGLPPFLTDALGYLEGRGQLQPGDQLLALAPISVTQYYTLYDTNGIPNALGLTGDKVRYAGVQTITVSSAHPLQLFNLEVSLEWDAHNDPLYLDQLDANLERASEYLYDFTNGQIALGQVHVLQNRDDWEWANVTVMGSNRLRPWGIEGGVVITPTAAPFSSTMQFGPGQIAIGSVWNRYGSPGASMGEDWPIILAHELSHYMLFLDDVYLGIDANGQLIPLNTCKGSAMGDLYSDPANTEFIFNEQYWKDNCANTLANQTVHRDEWEVITGWYNHLVTPTDVNPGPSSMPFDFTSIQIHDPFTPTNTLLDPTFYIAYANSEMASPAARAFLEKRDAAHNSLRMINLGAPYGGQNRVAARGARLGDRLCVFDPTYNQFGCEDIKLGDDTLTMRQDTTWNPVVSLTPINSTTLNIAVSLAAPLDSDNLEARLFPDYGLPYAPVPLHFDGSSYTATLQLREVTASGSIQVYVAESAAPRRETILPFSVGGNPGYMRGSGGYMRGSGGYMRGSGGYMRGSGGYMRGSGAGMRSGNAPILSPDGSLIFYTSSEITFTVGSLFTIQNMTGLPALPAGRELIGQAYRIIVSPGATLPEGSVSLQYLQNDVTLAGALESDLALYFYNGSAWHELNTIKDDYFNLVSAPSQGPGIYALFSSIRVPLFGPGWNNFAYPLRETQTISQSLASITGTYSIVYSYKSSLSPASWQVYDPNLPVEFEWVNTLRKLEFGNGYWIYVTEPITAHFGGVSALSLNPSGSNSSLEISPVPATFYGVVQPGPNLTPTPGMPVTAWVNGELRGQTLTRQEGSQIVYSLQVSGAEAGATVAFRINDQYTAHTSAWDNTHCLRFDLLFADASRIFLPVITNSGFVERNSP